MSTVSRKLMRARKSVGYVNPNDPVYEPYTNKVPGGVTVKAANGVYTKPTMGTPVYVLAAGITDTSALPADWQWCISDQPWLPSNALGIMSQRMLSDAWTETDVSGNENAGIVPTRADGITVHSVPAPITYGRSETCWYDGADSAAFRFVAGDRIRLSYDFKGENIAYLVNANNNSWFCTHQVLGPSLNNTWGFAPESIMIEGGLIKMKGQPNSRTLYGVTTYPYADDTWYRYEEDILLGGQATGTIASWLNGKTMSPVGYRPRIDAVTLGSGTFYAGTGDQSLDLQWVYLKTGEYCGRDGALVNGSSTVRTRNRRLTVTKAANNTTTTWYEPSSLSAGNLRLHWRNQATDIISPVLDT